MYVQAIPKYFQNMKELIIDQQYENLIMAIFPSLNKWKENITEKPNLPNLNIIAIIT